MPSRRATEYSEILKDAVPLGPYQYTVGTEAFLASKGAQYNNTSLVPCSGVNIPATFAEYDGYMRNCMGPKNTCGNEWVQKETWAYNQQKDLKALSFETSLYDVGWML